MLKSHSFWDCGGEEFQFGCMDQGRFTQLRLQHFYVLHLTFHDVDLLCGHGHTSLVEEGWHEYYDIVYLSVWDHASSVYVYLHVAYRPCLSRTYTYYFYTEVCKLVEDCVKHSLIVKSFKHNLATWLLVNCVHMSEFQLCWSPSNKPQTSAAGTHSLIITPNNHSPTPNHANYQFLPRAVLCLQL